MTPKPLTGRGSQHAALKAAFFTFIFSRLLSGIFVYMGHVQRPNAISVGEWEGVSNWWFNPWTAYDSSYYITIAKQGYILDGVTTAFFPLYPWLLKVGGNHESVMVGVGILVSNLCFLISLYVLYRLTELDFGANVSKSTLWLLAFFPTTAFFSAVYSESTFLLLILISFYSARREQWQLAGIFGLLASLTRNPGALIFIALVFEYFHSINYDLRHLRKLPILFISLPLVGFICIQAYMWKLVGIPMAGVSSQQYFYRAPGWPWVAVWKDFVGFFTYLHFDIVTFVNLLVIILTAVLLVRFRRILRPSYGIYMIGLVLMNLFYYVRVPPHTTGTARYILIAFPFFQLLAFSFQRGPIRRFARPFAGTYIYTCFLFSFLFGIKSFIG